MQDLIKCIDKEYRNELCKGYMNILFLSFILLVFIMVQSANNYFYCHIIVALNVQT